MFRKKRDDYANLSAVWIMANRDENPLMFYKACAHNLGEGVDEQYVKKLVQKNRALFRPEAPKQLKDWLKQRKEDEDYPSWLPGDKSTQRKALDALEAKDTFRSQFRIGKAPEGKKYPDAASVEVIDWGLQYLDRRRRAGLELRDATAKAWQIGLVALVGIANIFVTIFWTN